MLEARLRQAGFAQPARDFQFPDRPEELPTRRANKFVPMKYLSLQAGKTYSFTVDGPVQNVTVVHLSKEDKEKKKAEKQAKQEEKTNRKRTSREKRTPSPSKSSDEASSPLRAKRVKRETPPSTPPHASSVAFDFPSSAAAVSPASMAGAPAVSSGSFASRLGPGVPVPPVASAVPPKEWTQSPPAAAFSFTGSVAPAASAPASPVSAAPPLVPGVSTTPPAQPVQGPSGVPVLMPRLVLNASATLPEVPDVPAGGGLTRADSLGAALGVGETSLMRSDSLGSLSVPSLSRGNSLDMGMIGNIGTIGHINPSLPAGAAAFFNDEDGDMLEGDFFAFE